MASLNVWSVLSLLSSVLSLNGLISFLFRLPEACMVLYFRLCGLSPCTVDLDGQTTLRFWTSDHRQHHKPDLVMIHGYGGNSRWQFIHQVRPLSQCFNLYIPDLLFFGNSHTKLPQRTEVFQATCVAEGLKRLGVRRFTVYGLSYGGYVAYRMAEMHPEEVRRVVIVSSGIVWTEEGMKEHIKKVERNVMEILVPDNPRDMRLLLSISAYKRNPLQWVPDFLLQRLINEMDKDYKKERLELAEHLLSKKTDPKNLPTLTQDTLIVWGDKDMVFPLYLAYQLQRHLGPKAKLEIIKDTGHAVNYDSPGLLTELIKSFALNSSSKA